MAPPGALTALTEVNPAIQDVRIERPDKYWEGHGYLRMTAPVRPPTSDDASVRIVVYVRLPDAGRIAARPAPDSRRRIALHFPPGTIADRIEYAGSGDIDAPPAADWQVLDVRGTILTDRSQRFHVYRPTGGARAPLLGIEWPRDDDGAQAQATSALGELVRSGAVLGPSSASARQGAAARLRGLNECASCHMPRRAPREHIDDPGVVNRGSDDDGFFQPSTVFDDRAPLETYRPRDANRGDSFIRYACGREESPALIRKDRSVTCADRSIPVAILDMQAALRAGDAHAQAVCASRRALFDRLDAPSRQVVQDAVALCDERNATTP